MFPIFKFRQRLTIESPRASMSSMVRILRGLPLARGDKAESYALAGEIISSIRKILVSAHHPHGHHAFFVRSSFIRPRVAPALGMGKELPDERGGVDDSSPGRKASRINYPLGISFMTAWRATSIDCPRRVVLSAHVTFSSLSFCLRPNSS